MTLYIQNNIILHSFSHVRFAITLISVNFVPDNTKPRGETLYKIVLYYSNEEFNS